MDTQLHILGLLSVIALTIFSPLIYTLDIEDMENARDGFENKGYKYPGVLETIDNLKWAIENDTWNISHKNYSNNGILNIKE